MVFTRWTRRSDSVFLSLGRSIKISALTAGYFLLNAFTTNAQTDTIKIQEVTISAYKTPVNFADAARIISLLSAGEIEDAPLTSINDALKSAMNVDVRERGVYGVQSDLNIRGGSFDQNVVLINGVRMSDPQTGHFQMNLPIDLIDIERIEMLHGASSSLYGNNAFSGAINIITGNDDRSGVKVGLLAGEHELFGGNIALNLSTKKIKNYLSVAKKVSAGYTQNTDFDILNLFYKGKLITDAGALQLQAGYLDKSFGANNFYTPVYPNQYEENKTWMANLKFFTNGNFKISPSIYFRRNFDRFELFRNNPPAWYSNHNYHTTDVYGAEIGTQFNTGSGQMALGADWNTESILSNKLGEVLDNEQAIKGVEGVSYTNGKTRQNFTAFFEQRFRFNNLQISTSLSANFNSMFDWNFYPGIDLSLNINPNFKLIASASRSGRIPTYTDLYYVGPTNIGNPDLKTETANTFEFGSKYITKTLIIQSAIFFRQGNNIIDWVKINADDPWQSNNIVAINTIGVEISAKFMFQEKYGDKFPVHFLQFNYAYLDMDKSSDLYTSKYVLDYLRHNAGLTINHNIVKNLTANWQMNFQYRNGSYFPYTEESGIWAYRNAKNYEPLYLMDLKITYRYENFDFYIQGKNIFDNEQQDIENVLLPGRWISGGLLINLKFN